MWIPRWYFEAQARRVNDLERRVKRLESILLKDAENKYALIYEGLELPVNTFEPDEEEKEESD